MRTRALAFGLMILFLYLAGQAVDLNAERPTIVVALGMRPEQVVERSTFPVKWSLIPVGQHKGGGTLVTSPHRLVYEDAALRLVLPDAGNRISMPTGIVVTFDLVDLVTASVLGEYVDLKTAIERSKSLLEEVRGQGFDYGPVDPDKWRYPKFLLARKNAGAPRTVDSFEEMEQVFLNSRYYLQEFVVFVLEKSKLRVSLRVTNMRRRFTENRISLSAPIKSVEERAAHEAELLDEVSLSKERAYYLEVSIAKRTR